MLRNGERVSTLSEGGRDPHQYGPETPERSRLWLKYGLAVLMSILALATRLSLAYWIGSDRPLLILFHFFIIVTAYVGGLGPGLVSTVLIGLSVRYFVLPPVHTFSIERPADLVQWLLLIAGGTLISVLSGMLHRSRRAAKGSERLQMTDRKRANEALRRYELLAGHGRDIILFLRRDDGCILEANLAATKAYGYTRDELLSMTIRQLRAPQTLGQLADQMAEADAHGVLLETVHRRKDGSTFPVEISSRGETLNEIRTIISVVRDITERKKVEEELREKEYKYRALFEAANDGIFLQDPTGFVDCNERGASMYGLTREEVIGRSPADLCPERQPDGRLSLEVASEKIRAAMDGEPQSFEWQSLRADGVPFDVEINLSRVELRGSAFLQAIVRDIADRKRAEEALRASEGRFRLAWETSPDALSISSLKDGTYLDVNDGYTFLTGYSREEVVGKSALEIPFWADVRDRAPFAAALARQGHLRNYETKLRRRDGETRTILISAGLMRLNGDRHLLAVTKDIEDIKQAEEALRASEEKYRYVVENANDAIFIAQDGFVKFPNSRLEAISGYSLEELTQRPFLDFVHPEDRATVASMHRKRMEGEQVPTMYSFRGITKSGETIWLEISSVFRMWEGRAASLNFMRDITQEKRLESQLIHAHKMEAVGTLAGGIAHDFNNLLQAVSGYAELLLQQTSEGDKGFRALREIKRAASRGGELTRQLLTFSRKVEPQLRPVDLNIIVSDVRTLLERTIPKMIQIELHLASDLNLVNADSSQIEQVLMNLVVNGRDAMPDGGTLSIHTSNITLDEPYCRSHQDVVPGEYVLLAVADTGFGIDKETREHVFDPFFTTKEVGKGSGLGLAIVYGIVKSHQGHVLCASCPGQGTAIEIYLPVVERALMASNVSIAPTPLHGGDETILLVDDDASIRDLGEQTLRLYGYTVISAPDGESALEVYREHKNRIDMVILDLIMPGMGGALCLQALVEINPKVKVLIASGYSAEGEHEKAIASGARAFLQKPYELHEMLEAVRQALKGESHQEPLRA